MSAISALPPIGVDETLLRRVPPVWLNDDVPPRPKIDAFLPRRWKSDGDKGDHNGLSVNREWLTVIERVAKHPDTGEEQNVLRVSVSQIRAQQLSAVAAPIDGDPSHALIPELNSIDYKDDSKKKWMKTVARALTLECKIVHVCPAIRDDADG